MKNGLKIIALSLAVACLLCGCKTSQQRAMYNTLASVGYTTDSAFKAYVDLVVAGKLKPGTLPKVGGAYTAFQVAFNAALAVAQFSTNSVAPQDVIVASSVVINSIAEAKGSP